MLAVRTMSQNKQGRSDETPVVRKPLLTAPIEGRKTVERVEVKEINFLPHQKTGLHLHPCPVVGYIVKGKVLFQIDKGPLRTLKAGEAFYEPANTKILHFDALDEPVTFIANYLLDRNDEIIKMLDAQ